MKQTIRIITGPLWRAMWSAPVFAVMLTACAQQQVRDTDIQETPEETSRTTKAPAVTPQPTPEPARTATEKPAARSGGVLTQRSRYTVRKGDTLWDISGSGNAFSDPFAWPALYRANREMIEDPDLIFPRDELTLPLGLSESEKAEAREKARNVGPYEPGRFLRNRDLLDYLLE